MKPCPLWNKETYMEIKAVTPLSSANSGFGDSRAVKHINRSHRCTLNTLHIKTNEPGSSVTPF